MTRCCDPRHRLPLEDIELSLHGITTKLCPTTSSPKALGGAWRDDHPENVQASTWAMQPADASPRNICAGWVSDDPASQRTTSTCGQSPLNLDDHAPVQPLLFSRRSSRLSNSQWNASEMSSSNFLNSDVASAFTQPSAATSTARLKRIFIWCFACNSSMRLRPSLKSCSSFGCR